jgi:hypothetical protein
VYFQLHVKSYMEPKSPYTKQWVKANKLNRATFVLGSWWLVNCQDITNFYGTQRFSNYFHKRPSFHHILSQMNPTHIPFLLDYFNISFHVHLGFFKILFTWQVLTKFLCICHITPVILHACYQLSWRSSVIFESLQWMPWLSLFKSLPIDQTLSLSYLIWHHTGCNWNEQKNFWHKFHIPKWEKMSL